MNYPRSLILALPLDFAAGALIFCAAGALGYWINERLDAAHRGGSAAKPAAASALERTLLTLGLGYAGLCYGLWILCALGLGKRGWMVAVLPVIVVVLWHRLFAWIRLLRSAVRENSDCLKFLPRSFRVFLTAVVLCVGAEQLIANHAPTLERDDLSYHLYLPSSILSQGSLKTPPFAQRQSFYPRMAELAYVPAMAMRGELGVKSLDFFWWLGLPLLLAALARRLGAAHEAGTIAALSLLTSPLTLYLGETAMADLTIAYFVLAGLLALLAFKESGDRKSLLLSSLLTGFAMTKYIAWAYGLASAAIFFWLFRKDRRTALGGLILFALAGLAALLPEAIRLWVQTGNPLYPVPLLSLPHDAIEAAAQRYLWNHPKGLAILGYYLWNLWPNAFFLYDVPLMVLAPLILLLPSLKRERMMLALLWALIAFAVRFLSAGIAGVLPRYLLATHAVWLLLASAVWWEQVSRGGWRRKLFLGFLAAGLVAPSLAASTMRVVGPMRLHAGLDTAEGYLAKYYPSEGWDTVRFVNGLPAGSRVAVLDHHFMPYHYRDLADFLWPVPLDLLKERSPGRIAAALRAEKIDYVYFVRAQWRPSTTERGTVWSAVFVGPYVQCGWWASGDDLPFLKRIYESPGAVVYRVASSA